MHIYVQNVKFLYIIKLWPEGLFTDSDDANNNTDNDDISRTIHYCIGSLAFMPNEPKKHDVT